MPLTNPNRCYNLLHFATEVGTIQDVKKHISMYSTFLIFYLPLLRGRFLFTASAQKAVKLRPRQDGRCLRLYFIRCSNYDQISLTFVWLSSNDIKSTLVQMFTWHYMRRIFTSLGHINELNWWYFFCMSQIVDVMGLSLAKNDAWVW